MEFAVVLLEQGMENTPLHRFKAVLKIGNCPVFDYIRGVFKKVTIKEIFDICHESIIPFLKLP
jgi:hypothetical protein